MRILRRYGAIIGLLVVWTVAAAQPAPVGWTLQFSDDFSREQLGSDWAGSLATGRDGALVLGRENDMGNNFVACRRSFIGAQRLEYDAMAPTDQPSDLSAVLNCDDEGYAGGFLFGFGSQMNKFGQLMLKGQQVKQYDVKIVPRKWHHIVCRREGHRFTHVIDGKTVLDYTHPDPLPGPLHQQIGFYVWHVGLIDNVRVYTKPEQVRMAAATVAEETGKKLTVQARAYPDPGKILVSVEIPALAGVAAEASVALAVTLLQGKQVMRRAQVATATEMCEDVILDASDLQAGEHAVEVRLQAGKRQVGAQDTKVKWPGRSAAFKDIKVLNNFVWELLNQRVRVSGEPVSYTIDVPIDRWLLMRSSGGALTSDSVTVSLDGTPLCKHASGPALTLEAMRFVKAGQHTVQIVPEGGAPFSATLIVRAVPEIQHMHYPGETAISQGVKYDWEFLNRHILPHVNTVNTSGLVEEAIPHLQAWKDRGGRVISYIGRPGLHGNKDAEATPEAVADHYAKQAGYSNALPDGVLVDEFYHKEDPAYPALTGGIRLLNQRFPGKAFYPYAAGSFGKDVGSIPFAKACLEGGGYICWEAYLAEWPTLKQGLNAMRRYPEVAIGPLEQKIPGATHKTIWVFGVFSFPWPYADGHAGVNYNAYLDMQFQMLATHPALFGLGGVHIWRSGYSDEERLRWFGRFFRHYCLEGQTGRLSADPYMLAHIRNPDFAEGMAGWTLEPAAAGSIEPVERTGFGKFIGRYYRGPDTFLVTRRQADKPNVFSQEIRGLTKGRTYSVKMLTGDYGELQAGKPGRQVHPIAVEITGGEPLTEPRHNYQAAFPTRGRQDNYTDANPFYLNYHWHVFRATGPTATLRISDDKAPAGQQLLHTFIEVKPYLE